MCIRDRNEDIKDRIVSIVERLQNWEGVEYSLINPEGKEREEIQSELRDIEVELDEAIFDLYMLRVSERDLIRDMCDVGIEFCYNHTKSVAIKPVINHIFSFKHGLLETLLSSINIESSSQLKDYLVIFLKAWNRELYPQGEFSWRIIIPDEAETMLCVVFSTQEVGHIPQFLDNDEDVWTAILNELNDSLLVPYKSNRIYIDGIVRAVTDTDIIIIKRNEKRLWTKSMAREDVEATFLQAINLQDSKQGISV